MHNLDNLFKFILIEERISIFTEDRVSNGVTKIFKFEEYNNLEYGLYRLVAQSLYIHGKQYFCMIEFFYTPTELKNFSILFKPTGTIFFIPSLDGNDILITSSSDAFIGSIKCCLYKLSI